MPKKRPVKIDLAKLKGDLDKKSTDPKRWQSGTMRDRVTRGIERAKRVADT